MSFTKSERIMRNMWGKKWRDNFPYITYVAYNPLLNIQHFL